MVSIHPSAVISGDVKFESDVHVGPFAVITGPVRIGRGTWIGAGVIVGAPPEVRSWVHPTAEQPTFGGGVLIGDRVVLREGAQVHQGWKTQTVVGDDSFIMNQVYIAHDCHIGEAVTIASSALLAGHVIVGSGANLGLGASVHQRRVIGRGAMVGMGSVVTRDVPPFAKAFGVPARSMGANTIAMQRSGASERMIQTLDQFYRSTEPDDVAAGFPLDDPQLNQALLEWSESRVTK